MDNITHTLIGVVLGRTIKGPDPKFQSAAVWTAILGSNLPDLDFLFMPFVTKGNLGYMLHHRGFTHTFLFAIPLGILAAWVGTRMGRLKARVGWQLYLLGIGSVLLHLGADYCNNYGVHPFSPFMNQWLYGDFIFIFEPFFWFSILPFIFFTAQSLWGKGFSILLEVSLLSAILLRNYTPWPVTLALTLWAITFIGLQKKFRSLVLVYAGLFIIYLGFWLGSYVARKDLESAIQVVGLDTKIHQLVVTPAPSNPFCWSVISLTTEEDKYYVARIGILSLKPSLFSPHTCYFQIDPHKINSLAPVSLPTQTGFSWIGEFRRPLQEFEKLRNNNCRFKAFLKFARVPIWYEIDRLWIAEDLRYNHNSGMRFTRTDLSSHEECPDFIPPWDPPTHTISR